MIRSILLFLLTQGLFCYSQTLSPFWNIKQNTNFPIPAAVVRYMSVPNSKVAWATGYDNYAYNRAYNFFTLTKDGGNTYTSGNVFSDTLDYQLSSIIGLDSLNAWVSAYRKSSSSKTCDVLYKTSNSGVSWSNGGSSSMFSSSTSFVNFVTFLTPSVGIAVGDPVGGTFEIYRTIDGGNSWSAVSSTAIPVALSNEYGIVNVSAKSGNNIWFGTDNGRVFRSADGGQTWAVSTVTPASVYGVTNLSFTDPNNGLALIYTNGAYSLFNTNNGGATWNQINPIDPDFGYDDICNIPGTTFLASCGAQGFNLLISYSTDLGQTWNNWGGSLNKYYELEFVDAVTGYAGSMSSTMTSTVEGMFKYSAGPVGLNEKTSVPFATEVYPNPTNGFVYIKIPSAKEGLEIIISDAIGNIVYKEKLTCVAGIENYPINLAGLSKGVYQISLLKGKEKTVQKIVVQ